jgi:hypothetical protein
LLEVVRASRFYVLCIGSTSFLSLLFSLNMHVIWVS